VDVFQAKGFNRVKQHLLLTKVRLDYGAEYPKRRLECGKIEFLDVNKQINKFLDSTGDRDLAVQPTSSYANGKAWLMK